MKKIFALGALALALVISGCGDKEAAATSGAAEKPAQAQEAAKPAQSNDTILFGQLANKDVVIKLADNAATQSLRSMLPAELEFKDFNNTEKFAYPPNKLNVNGAPKGHATKASHYDDAIEALTLKLTAEDVKYLEELYTPHKIVGAL